LDKLNKIMQTFATAGYRPRMRSRLFMYDPWH